MIMSTKVRLVQNTLNLILKTFNNISLLRQPVLEITREYILGSFKVIFQESPLWLRYACLRKQPTFHDAATGFLTKWCLRNKCKNSILMMHHHPGKRSASDWLSQEENLLQPIKSSFQIISMEFLHLFLRGHFAGKPWYWLFSQVRYWFCSVIFFISQSCYYCVSTVEL